MKQLLLKHPRATYAAIIGFIVGSLPSVYVSTLKSAGMISQSFEIISLPASTFHYVVCIFLLILGATASYNFAVVAGKSVEDEEK